MSISDNSIITKDRIIAIINELKGYYETLKNKLETNYNKEKSTQLTEITKAIQNLESKNIPVPDELRRCKIQLISELDEFERARELLDYINSELKSLLNPNTYKSSINYSMTITEKSRKKRRFDITDNSVLKEWLIEALRYYGGRATPKEVISYIENHYKDQLKPNDFELRITGGNRDYQEPAWANNVKWTRYRLVVEGVLKKNSPYGIWELEDEYL